LLSICFSSAERASALEPRPNLFEVGFTYSNYDYSEKLTWPDKSDEEGNIPGICINYTYRKPKDLYFNIFGEIAWGETDYDGSYQDGTPAQGTTENIFARYDLNLGYTFLLWEKLTITPFIGIGSAQWRRDLQKHTPYYFSEKYMWDYAPAGLLITWEPTSRLSISARGVYRYMFDAKMKINGYISNKQARDLGDRYEYLIETPVGIRLSEHFNLNIVPSYSVRKFKQSKDFPSMIGDQVYLIYEPASRAITRGISVRIGYLF
jgi:hypothetical protein